MLFPLAGIPVMEYDATFVVTPTSRQGHDSDTVLATVEMLVRNDGAEKLKFPFYVLSTDPGTGAQRPDSLEPRVLNGSSKVEVERVEELDEKEAARLAAERAAAGGADAQVQAQVRAYAEQVLAAAERTRVGRTEIAPGVSRRIVVQQRLRVRPDAQGAYQLVTVAPSPLLTLGARGRVSVYVLLPHEDEDVRPVVDPGRTEQGYGYQLGRIRDRQVASWMWQNDPVLKLGWSYA